MSQKLCFSQELGEEVKFKKGDVVILTNEKELQDKCDRSVLYINSQYYLNLAKIGHKIWVGDGLLSFVVKEKCMFLFFMTQPLFMAFEYLWTLCLKSIIY